jgi:hypothetical protein
VRIDAVEGQVQLDVAYAFSKRIPRDASASRCGVAPEVVFERQGGARP